MNERTRSYFFFFSKRSIVGSKGFLARLWTLILEKGDYESLMRRYLNVPYSLLQSSRLNHRDRPREQKFLSR